MSGPLRPSRPTPVPAADVARLVGAALVPGAEGGADLTGVTLDSRAVLPGDLYAALPGARAHGASYADQAAQSGALAVLTDPPGVALLAGAAAELPRIVVPDPRAVLGELSAHVYGQPATALTLVGITGTNGKTTTAYLVEAAWRALGRRTGLIGTIETRVGERRVKSVRTTPESCDLHGLFALMREDGVQACVMEVSSHALALHRVDGVVFDVAVFTNLSQDHLDFHPTMADYFAAKASLFTPARARRGIVCVDDAWGARLAREAQIPVVTLATPAGAGQEGTDWRLAPCPESGPGVFDLVGAGETLRLRSALPGAYNEVNTALAALTLRELGTGSAEITAALAAGAVVPGRMEAVELGAGAPTVYVDFAHTPEAIRATLAALRQVTPGRLVAVLGAGGARDRGKRPLMGAAAARGADVVVVTDDNPRDEDPAVIRADVAAGAREAAAHPASETGVEVVEVDRRRAGIAEALRRARPGDVVAVLGRGHETHQEVHGEMRPFVDREAVQAAWTELAG